MKWYEIISAVLAIIPALIKVMFAIEEAIPGQGKGEQKLAAVRGIVEASHAEATVLWPALEKSVTTLTSVFNSTEAFKKK